MPSRPVAQEIAAVTSTSTGAASGAVNFGTGMTAASFVLTFTGSTKAVSAQLQGSMGHSGSWFAISAATTMTTGAAQLITSTGTMVFDKARFVLTTNATTGNGSISGHALAR